MHRVISKQGDPMPNKFFNQKLCAFAAAATIICLTACGPMNSRPATHGNLNDALAPSATSLIQSKKGAYVIFTSVISNNHTMQLGDNELQFRFVKRTDGSYLSADAKVEGECSRAAAKIKKPHTLDIKRAEDGSYHTILSVKKAGDWNVLLKISDQQVEDEFEFAITL